jgi:hypothetical protein
MHRELGVLSFFLHSRGVWGWADLARWV